MRVGVVGLGYVGLPPAELVFPLVVGFRGVTRSIEAPHLVRL